MLFAVLLVAFGVAGALNPPLASSRKRYDGYKVLSVIPVDAEALGMLNHIMVTNDRIDFWQEPSYVGSEVHMMVPPEELSRVEEMLQGATVVYNTHIEDVQDQLTPMWNDIESRSLNPEQQAFNIDDYNTIDDIYSWLRGLASNCRSGLTCELYSIGNSYEGQPLYVFKISKSGSGRKGYWIDATIHAREWIATATVIKILNHLATGGDANAVALTDAYDWYIMPVMNADGYRYTWSNDRLWRKNRRPTPGSLCIGTDLNRNFDFRWGTDGVSHAPCNDIFCGESGGSEPETQAVQNELVRLGPTLAASVTVHSYGNMWMFPWGNTVNFAGAVCERASDHAELMRVADATANAIQATYNTRWSRGNSCEVIYATSGGTDDFAKGVAGVKYAFCPELRGNSFVIAASNIPLSFNEVWNGVVAMTNAINA
jgi:carboxypeptidase A2